MLILELQDGRFMVLRVSYCGLILLPVASISSAPEDGVRARHVGVDIVRANPQVLIVLSINDRRSDMHDGAVSEFCQVIGEAEKRMDLHERLEVALEQAELSVRAFHRALDEHGTPGTYSTVHGYVSGKTEPGVSWVESAAQVLEVDPAWLAFGERPNAVLDDVSGLIDGVLGSYGFTRTAESVVRAFCFHVAGGMTAEAHFADLSDDPEFDDRKKEYLKQLEESIPSFVEGAFGRALRLRNQGPKEFTAAVLSEASVAYLEYGPLPGWG